ncbi:MAG TPA: hypothetical protein V6D10_20235 [Trichocoleus sp.]
MSRHPAATMILTASSVHRIAMPCLLAEVSQALSQDSQSIRVRKLLAYICTNHWIDDRSQLEALHLNELLQTLLTLAPTLEQLQIRLEQVVKTLNKAAEYMVIANAIIRHVSKLYVETESTPIAKLQDYQAIVPVLEHDIDSLRLKKLLVLACTNQWENDPQRLRQYSYLGLVQSVHQLAPCLESLKAVLSNLVKTLSKRSEYALIAHRIVQAFQPLYVEEATYILSTVNSVPQPEASTQFSPIAEATEALSVLLQPAKPTPSLPEPLPSPSLSITDLNSSRLFDLRQEIMQYSNPYRIKILIFSLLHEPFQPTPEHESMLKGYELDELLRMLLKSYKQFAHLESCLNQTVKQLDDPEAYQQTVTAMLRSIKPLYSKQLSLWQATPEAPANTEVLGNKAGLNEATQPEWSQQLTQTVLIQPSISAPIGE